MRFGDEEDFPAVWRPFLRSVFGGSGAVSCSTVDLHYQLNANVSRGVRLFVDLLDVASVSQGLMLNRYLRLE